MGKCVYIPRTTIDETLRNKPVYGKRLLEPLKKIASESGLPFNILEDREVLNDAEIHNHENDLWLCLEGEVVFTVDGELVNPWPKRDVDGSTDDREWKAKEIKGGSTITMRPGDWLYVPAGSPHKHDCPSGIARLVIIKISAKHP